MLHLKSHEGHFPAEKAALLTVEVVTSLEGILGLRADFAHMERVCGNTVPFSLFEWQFVWLQHFPRQGLKVHDQPLFHVVRDAAGECVGILPLILTVRSVGSLRFTSLCLIGADPGITEIRTALVRPGYEERVAAAVHEHLNAAPRRDWIQWTGDPDRFNAALGRLRGLDWQTAAPSYVLDLPATWDLFRAGLKRNIRESLRHCYNSLKRDGHAFTLKVASNPADVRAALERLFVLHTLRANMPGTVQHPNRFAAARLRDFVQEVCGALAQRNVVRVFQVEINGEVVASRVAFVVGDSLYLYYSGYDPEWAKYSVMTTVVTEAIKYAIEMGLKTVNLSPGKDVSKTRWGPREVLHNIAFEQSDRWLSRMVRHAYVKARSGAGAQGWILQKLIPGRRNWD